MMAVHTQRKKQRFSTSIIVKKNGRILELLHAGIDFVKTGKQIQSLFQL
jgi:hypothetical protein